MVSTKGRKENFFQKVLLPPLKPLQPFKNFKPIFEIGNAEYLS